MKTCLTLVLALLLGPGTAALLHADSVKVAPFGQTADGQKVDLYTLTNKSGASVSIMTYGATVVKLIVPDQNGKLGDVILGFDDLAPYLTKSPYFGAVVGRYGNRIAAGKFSLDGKDYHLAINNPPNSLHGGLKGFDKRVWEAHIVSSTPPTLRLSRVSPDGEEGFPGDLKASVTYTWSDRDELQIHYVASTDKDTVLNLTNHTYFNLAGQGNGTILDHLMMINADAFTPVDSTLIPTGEIKQVANTPWDFRTPTKIGQPHRPDWRQPGRVRSQLRAEQEGRGEETARGQGDGADHRPDAEGLHRPARRPVLLGQLPRRHAYREGRQDLSAIWRVLPRDAAFPRLAQPRQLPLHRAEAGRDLRDDDRLRVRHGEVD